MATVKGIAKWAFITKPNTHFDPVYCIDLKPSSSEDLEYFRANGFKIKVDKDTGDEYVVFKRKTEWPSGDPKDPPKLVDKTKTPIDVLVGNGSEVVVQYDEYSGEWRGKPFQGLELKAVQVLNLVEYDGPKPDGSEFETYDEEIEF